MASLLSLHPSKPISPIRATAVSTQSLPAQTLDEKFGRKGIKFTQDQGDVPSVELSVRNGSSLRLRVPDGLVTSYRPKVYWKDDGFEEVLHTLPDAAGTGQARGGLGLVLNDESKPSPWAAAEWVVKDADSDSIDAVQVELSCTNGDGSLDITYVVTLYPLSMATAVVVKNRGKKPAKLRSAILSHLKFKSRKGSAVQGLRGCSYCAHPPPASSFGIMSPSDAMRPEPTAGWFSFSSEEEDAKGGWTVEDDMYTILRGKLSRVYAAPPEERTKRIYRTPPSKFQTIDQGSKLGFRIIRMGFEDIYLSSPGSLSKQYSDQYFICTGPASILVPVDLKPGEDWRGAQVIEHDNL